ALAPPAPPAALPPKLQLPPLALPALPSPPLLPPVGLLALPPELLAPVNTSSSGGALRHAGRSVLRQAAMTQAFVRISLASFNSLDREQDQDAVVVGAVDAAIASCCGPLSVRR